MSPNSPPIPPIAPHVVEVLAFEDVQLLDLAGVTQVFAAANEIAHREGRERPYAVRVIAPSGAEVRATSGLVFLAEPLPDGDPPDTLLVLGGQGVMRAADDDELVEWLRRRAAVSPRVASVCTGAFLLAQAGRWTAVERSPIGSIAIVSRSASPQSM